MKKHLLMIIIAAFICSCDKKNPHPELSDEIYKDLAEELSIATKSLEEEEKLLAQLYKDKEKVVPQTGQIKYAMKKIYDSEAKVNALKQQKNFFEIKLELRKAEAQFKYEQSLKPNGPPWPDPKEIEDYKTMMKIQRDKLLWDKNRGVKKYVPRGTGASGDGSTPASAHEAPSGH